MRGEKKFLGENYYYFIYIRDWIIIILFFIMFKKIDVEMTMEINYLRQMPDSEIKS